MIYLDNSATTKQYDEVTKIMLKYMEEDFGNPSSLYQLGVDAEKAIKNAKKQVLRCAELAGLDGSDGERSGYRNGSCGAFSAYDVVFTSGGTEADNMAIFGAAKALRRTGNRIVTTAVEHPAVLECCKALEREGFEIIKLGVDRKCRLDLEEVESAINDKTILFTMMQVNNEAGTIMPVDTIRKIMDSKGSRGLFHCDAVQSFGKMPLPGSADLISVSGHKIHGPKGSGALLINKDRAGRLPAFIVGGGQEAGMRSGTENVPAIVGFGNAAKMACCESRKHESADEGISSSLASMHELGKLREMLRKGLEENIEDISVNSPIELGGNGTAGDHGKCCPTILNVTFKGTRGEVLLHTLEQDEIYVSTGSACSSNKKGQSHVLEAMGLSDKEIEATLRFSLGRFNTEEDIKITIEKVAEAVKRFRRLGSFR